KRTVGADEEQVDGYIGPHPESRMVYVVDQVDPNTKAFDEHKAILGVNSVDEAKDLYDAGFSDGSGPSRRRSILQMSIEQFREWLKGGDTKKPAAQAEEAKPKRPRDLLEFLAENGGVRDQTGELRAMDADKWHMEKGAGRKQLTYAGKFRPRLVRPDGMPPDEARRLAQEFGYLRPDPEHGNATSTIDDLYEAMRRNLAGHHVFSERDYGRAMAWQEA